MNESADCTSIYSDSKDVNYLEGSISSESFYKDVYILGLSIFHYLFSFFPPPLHLFI